MLLLVERSELRSRLRRELILKMSDKLHFIVPLSMEPSGTELNDKLQVCRTIVRETRHL
jgi:hypothetical protein